MKRIIFTLIPLLLAVLIFVPGALADEGTMAAANALAANGRTAEAIRAYETLLSQGVQDPALYYNLGNAYYQNGEVGQAVLNFRRAAQAAPRDTDIQHNLALARQQVNGSSSGSLSGSLLSQPDNLAAIFLVDVAQWLTLNETAVLALLLWTLLCVVVVVVRQKGHGHGRSRLLLKASLLPLALLFMLAAFTLGSRLKLANELSEAVIVAQVADVYAGPDEQYGSDFQLPGGTELALYQTRGDWAQIGAPGTALRGWVNAGSVTAVNP